MYRFVHLLRKFAKNKKVNVKDCKIWVAQSFDLPKELPKAKKDIFLLLLFYKYYAILLYWGKVLWCAVSFYTFNCF